MNLFWFLFEQLYKFKPSAFLAMALSNMPECSHIVITTAAEVSGIGLKMMIQCIARRVAHIPALLHSMRSSTTFNRVDYFANSHLRRSEAVHP